MALTREEEIGLVRSLRFANLTPPVLAQMRESAWTWRSLVDMARNAASASGRGATWGPDAHAGSLQMRLSKRFEARVGLLFWSGPKTCGPDGLGNKRLDVNRCALPETLKTACVGRPVSDVVDMRRFHGAVGPEIVRRVETFEWGLGLHLRLAYVQPEEADILRMAELHDQGLRDGSTI